MHQKGPRLARVGDCGCRSSRIFAEEPRGSREIRPTASLEATQIARFVVPIGFFWIA